MNHIVTDPAAPFAIAGGALTVHQVPLGRDNLGWLLVHDASGDCAVVDGPGAGPYLERIDAEGWRLRAVLNTHTHGDHIGVNHDLARRGRLAGVRVYGAPGRGVPGLTDPVGEGDTVTFGGVELAVWLTEGHLDGHLSFVADGAVFCGDTMFAGGCGYLFDGPPATMYRSLQRIAGLPEGTRVCCAHEYTEDNLLFARFVDRDNPSLDARSEAVAALRARGGCAVPSTVAEERATNPFLRAHVPEIRRAVSAALGENEPASDHEMFHMIRRLKDSKAHRVT